MKITTTPGQTEFKRKNRSREGKKQEKKAEINPI
jgi:hypothetical protein